MSTPGDDRPRASSDLSPVTLALASLASVVATVTVSRFGLAGTLAGAALAPVVIAVVRELGRTPVERVVRLPSGARAVVERRPRVRPRTVALTAGIAFAATVAIITVPDLIAGTSVVSDRPSTFFSPRDRPPDGGGVTTAPSDAGEEPVTAPPAGTPETAPAPATTAPADPPPAATAPAPVETAPAPVETAPAAPATAPEAVPPPG